MRTCASRRPFSARMFGDVVRRVGEPQVELEAERLAASAERRPDRREHRALQPRRRLAASVDRGLVIHRRRRVVEVEMDVVFARPDHLDRLAELLRQHRRFGRVVGLRLAAEAAAEQRHVADDVLLVDADARPRPSPAPPADSASASRPRPCRSGSRRPRPAAPSTRARPSACSRSPRAPCRPWRTPRRRCRGCARPSPACCTVVDHLLLERLGVEARVRAVVPVDLQLLAALQRRPGVVGDDGDAAERLEQQRRLDGVERHGLRARPSRPARPCRRGSCTVPPSTGGCSIDA